MLRLSARVLAATTLLFTLTLIWFALTAPDPVPGHFDISGGVDRWESKDAFVWSMAGIGLALVTIFGSTRLWIGKIPASAINLPGRKRHDHWTSPSNRTTLDHIIATSLEILGIATVGLLTSIVVISGAVAGGTEIPGVVFGAQLVVFLAVFVLGIGYLIGKTRLPK